MFGWINDCTESLVVSKFGVGKWHEIKEKAGCKVSDGCFIRHKYYTDESTVALVVAASEVLGIPVDGVLEAFGQYFMEFTRTNGYDNLLSCQGSTLRLWLSNLNALHDHLQSSLPKGFVAPVFWCEDDDDNAVEGCNILLHYYSQRGCLLVPLVVGVVKEVSRYHFGIEVNMERLQMQTVDDAKYTTWRISAVDPSLQWKLTMVHNTKEGVDTKKHTAESPDGLLNTHAQKNGWCPFAKMSQEMRKQNVSREEQQQQQANNSISMSGDKMREVFPYHVVVDGTFRVIQYGNQLPGILGLKQLQLHLHIEKYLVIRRPVLGCWDWNVLQKLEDQTFFLESVSNNNRQTVRMEVKFKANIIHLSSEPKQVMFVISPDVKNVVELHEMNLTMSDLPLHSFQRDAVFLGEHMYSEVRSAHKLEKLSNKLKHEKELSNTLLYSMLPKEVADLLRSGKTFEPEHHENVTLFFSDVVGFTSMSAELAPWEIIDMLNSLYTLMDYLAEKFKLYKVETIGDAYMCCSGLPKEDEKHAENIANFALAVKECVTLVKSPLTGEPIHLRMGIHTGSCMSGVVGNLTPHYCLFGDMINTTSRHESTCLPDMIQASSITYGKLKHFSDYNDDVTNYYNWTPRGLVEMKGKGKMFTYWLDSGTEYNPHVGPNGMEKLYNEVKQFLATKTWKKRNYFVRRNFGRSSIASTDYALGVDNYQSLLTDDEVPEFKPDDDHHDDEVLEFKPDDNHHDDE